MSFTQYTFLLMSFSAASILATGDDKPVDEMNGNPANRTSIYHHAAHKYFPEITTANITAENFETLNLIKQPTINYALVPILKEEHYTPVHYCDWNYPHPVAGGGLPPRPKIDYGFWRKKELKSQHKALMRVWKEDSNRTLYDAFLRHSEQRRDSQLLDIRNISLFQPSGNVVNAYNTENVEDTERRDKTKKAIEVVYGITKQEKIDEDQWVQDVIAYLVKIKATEDHYNKFVRVIHSTSEKMNEVDNALRVISADNKTSRDHPKILTGDVYLILNDHTQMSVKGLLARTWWIIMNRHVGKDQELLQFSLVKALGQCIEDDDHRVCGNGKSQRLVTVLQGYLSGIKTDDTQDIPPVKSFMKVICDEKEPVLKELFNASDAERLDFAKKMYKEVMENARKIYGDSKTHLTEVEALLKNFAEYVLFVSEDIAEEKTETNFGNISLNPSSVSTASISDQIIAGLPRIEFSGPNYISLFLLPDLNAILSNIYVENPPTASTSSTSTHEIPAANPTEGPQ